MAKYIHAAYVAFIKEDGSRRFIGDSCLKIADGQMKDVRRTFQKCLEAEYPQYTFTEPTITSLTEISEELFNTLEPDITTPKHTQITPEILEKNGFLLLDGWQLKVDSAYIRIVFKDKISVEIQNLLKGKDKEGRCDLVTFARDWCESFTVLQLEHAMQVCGINKKLEING